MMWHKRGLSLIEILIAIGVFAIGVLSVLQLVIHNISTVRIVKHQTAATMLASEWLEMMYTWRNTNLLKELPWNCLEFSEESAAETICEVTMKAGDVMLISWVHETTDETILPYISLERIDLNSDAWWDELWESAILYPHTDSVDIVWSSNNNQETLLSRYDHDPSQQQEESENISWAYYARYLTLESYGDDDENILKVISHILIKETDWYKEVILEWLIGNIRR